MLSSLWNEILYRPLYNALVFLTSVIPGHHLWLAIIILTVTIRFILYIPSKKGLNSQTKLQEIQPKLAAIKERHKANPQLQAKETMKLYKESGVNPFGSCLPLLIQLPVLIALFSVFRKGLIIDPEILYAPLKSFDPDTINVFLFGWKNVSFFGESLSLVEKTKFSRYVMPFIVGGLQFYQMKMLSLKNKKPVVVPTKKPAFDPQASTKMMTYFMPLMIAFFSAGYPAGLSMYWAASTAFSIGQQKVVLKARQKINISSETEKEESIPEAEVKPVKKLNKSSKSRKQRKNK